MFVLYLFKSRKTADVVYENLSGTIDARVKTEVSFRLIMCMQCSRYTIGKVQGSK